MRYTHSLLNIFKLFTIFCLLLFIACKDKNTPEPPVGLKAAFSATPFEGHAPLSVQFTDESTGDPTSWKWDFQGDGSYDALVSDPSFIYDEPGFYDVKLLVSNASDTDSVTLIDYIYLNRDDVQLNYTGSLSANIGSSIGIPLKIGLDTEISALTLKLFYDTRLMEVDSIEGVMQGFLSSIDHETGSVVVVWSSVDPLAVNKNDELFLIKATLQAGIDPISHYMRIGEGTEFADPSASIIEDVELVVPYIDVGN